MHTCVHTLSRILSPLAGKRIKMASLDDDAEAGAALGGPLPSDLGDAAHAQGSQPERRFRGQRMETPSHPGG